MAKSNANSRSHTHEASMSMTFCLFLFIFFVSQLPLLNFTQRSMLCIFRFPLLRAYTVGNAKRPYTLHTIIIIMHCVWVCVITICNLQVGGICKEHMLTKSNYEFVLIWVATHWCDERGIVHRIVCEIVNGIEESTDDIDGYNGRANRNDPISIRLNVQLTLRFSDC